MQKLLHCLHPLAGALAILCILSFMTASVISELYGSAPAIAATKHMILWGLLVLIPCLAFTGLSGYRAVGRSPRGQALVKLKRMRIIGINGICVLVPCAFFLAVRAAELRLDRLFYGVQIMELLAGSLNLALLILNFRDGLRLVRFRQI
ncbi:hypothetical protein [Novacetimonas hansenii]|uniref:Lipoprotein n=1 Tax=Novacetimonas hansenii TaxID=436 RepID=A0AAW5ENU6_NOVHA|nr:hypothetical protein [Novacetimonas hansenii]MCJ8352925.1 hypothetical protein [Novacetimonas hansenii]